MTDLSQRILVAEDDSVARETLASFLREEGYTVDVAADGEQALEMCDAAPPALVLTDLDMPKLSGARLIEELRARHPGVEIAVITAELTVDAGRRATALGVRQYFNKPLNLDEIARRIGQLLRD